MKNLLSFHPLVCIAVHSGEQTCPIMITLTSPIIGRQRVSKY
jgi:hypothetical protein